MAPALPPEKAVGKGTGDECTSPPGLENREPPSAGRLQASERIRRMIPVRREKIGRRTMYFLDKIISVDSGSTEGQQRFTPSHPAFLPPCFGSLKERHRLHAHH
ncbi:MAG TPA: hypothetical protein DEQ80_03180 [Anaerolinea thermolimosa]|uniref:Uncharacterized protein n=1 Tax=Anaerolinea thermolimosa TaxID=229919 RepID=A0A3D1JE27_9CHLR|nr:hypothetical protein [Anaerolinea thermolimosa]